MADPETTNERRRRLTHRAVPACVVAVGAMGIGLAVGSGRESEAERSAKRSRPPGTARTIARCTPSWRAVARRTRWPRSAGPTSRRPAPRPPPPPGWDAGGADRGRRADPRRGRHRDLRRAARRGLAARRRGRRRGLVAGAGLPRSGRGRAARPPDPGAAAGADRVGGRQGAGRGPGDRALVTRGRRLVDRRHGRAQRRPGRPGRRLRPWLPARHARGHQRARAGAAEPGRGLPRRHAAGRSQGAGPGQGAPRAARAVHDRQPPAGGRRRGAGRPAGRHRRAGPRDRRGPGPGRHRLLGAPAARVHVQGHHHRGGAGEEEGQGRATGSRSRPRP